MSLQPLTAVNCAGLVQPGFSLLELEGDVYLFGQKGWPKRSCPTGIFGVRIKNGELRLRAISFSNTSCYLPPLRCPAIAHFEPHDNSPECYLIHGGRTPNNELSSSLYMLSVDSRGCNHKVTLCCQEKELVGDVPSARYGHTLSVIHSRGKTACVLFGGRSYMPPTERTTENWNSVVDCPPQVFLIDLEFGCCTAHTLPELTDGQSFHVALAREDCVYFLGGHILSSDCRPPRLIRPTCGASPRKPCPHLYCSSWRSHHNQCHSCSCWLSWVYRFRWLPIWDSEAHGVHIHWPGRCRSPHGASWTSSVDQWGNPQPYLVWWQPG